MEVAKLGHGESQFHDEDARVIHINFWFFGKFIVKDGVYDYVGGALLKRSNVKISELNVEFLRKTAFDGMKALSSKARPYFSLWFNFSERNLVGFKRIIECEADVQVLVESMDKDNVVVVYTREEESPSKVYGFGKPNKTQQKKLKNVKKEKGVEGAGLQIVGDELRPVRRSPRFKVDDDVVILMADCTPTKSKNLQPRKSLTFNTSPSTEIPPTQTTKNNLAPTTLTKDIDSPFKSNTPRRKQVARKPKKPTKSGSEKKKGKKRVTKTKGSILYFVYCTLQMGETRYNNSGILDLSQPGPSTQQSQITTAPPTAQPGAQPTAPPTAQPGGAQTSAQATKTTKAKQVGRPKKLQTISKAKKP